MKFCYKHVWVHFQYLLSENCARSIEQKNNRHLQGNVAEKLCTVYTCILYYDKITHCIHTVYVVAERKTPFHLYYATIKMETYISCM